MQQLYITLNIGQSYLSTPKVKIPLKFKLNFMSKHYTIAPRSKLIARVPVTIPNGEIYLRPIILHGNLIIPEGIYTSTNNYAIVEVVNYSPRVQNFVIENPIECEEITKNHFEVNNYNIRKIETENIYQNQSITELIRTKHLNSEEKQCIENLCIQYEDIFKKEDDELTFTNVVKHNIDLVDEKPIFTKSYRYPHIHKQEVEKQINDMLNQGIIRPSFSPWSSPIWIVPKKKDATGQVKWRMVIDYRKLNDKTISDRYPLPNITDILDKLGKCIYFTTLDLASGFHQIEVNPKDIQKTAFSVEFGHYEYVRMPFGLKNAPSTFQRVMDNVLGELQGKVCLCYMDDIIIFSTSLQEHIDNLKKVFTKLQNANLKVQLDKSEFLHKEVAFLGHIVTSEGVKPNPDKIAAIQKFPIPTTEKQIKSFLGLLGYYRKFIKNFATITKPMTACLRKDSKIILDENYKNCFEQCKTLLCSKPILQYPDFNEPFILTTDASNIAIGAVLSQGTIGKDLPICYASRTLNKSEQNYSTIEKELLAIVWASKYFRPYLFGNKFTIVTDHRPLTWLFSLKEPNSKLVRWRLKLEEFDYQIVYKKGVQNSNADALSRIQISSNNIEAYTTETSSEEDTASMSSLPSDPIPTTKNSINTFENQIIIYLSDTLQTPSIIRETLFETRTRVTLHLPRKLGIKQTIKEELRKLFGRTRKLTCTYASNECFEYIKQAYIQMISQKPRTTIPKVSLVRSLSFLTDIQEETEQNTLIKSTHELNDHRGIIENYDHIRQKYYFPHLKEKVRDFINKCDTCQKIKYDRQPPQLQFSLTETPKRPLEIIHIDLFQIQSNTFLTIIDKFSKFAAAYKLDDKTDKTILEKLTHFCSLHGIPNKLISDNEVSFTSRLIKQFLNKYNIQFHTTTPYNSTGNSPVERLHSTLIELSSVIVLKNPEYPLEQVMNQAILSYNNSIHSSTKLKPFDLLRGHISGRTLNFENEMEYLAQHRENYDQLCNDIYEQSLRKKTTLINKLNSKRKPVLAIKPDQFVYVKKKRRGKIKPDYRKLKVLEDKNITINTQEGKVHKSKIKNLFQVCNRDIPRN